MPSKPLKRICVPFRSPSLTYTIQSSVIKSSQIRSMYGVCHTSGYQSIAESRPETAHGVCLTDVCRNVVGEYRWDATEPHPIYVEVEGRRTCRRDYPVKVATILYGRLESSGPDMPRIRASRGISYRTYIVQKSSIFTKRGFSWSRPIANLSKSVERSDMR